MTKEQCKEYDIMSTEYMIKEHAILLKGNGVIKHSSIIRKINCLTVSVKATERNVLSDEGRLVPGLSLVWNCILGGGTVRSLWQWTVPNDAKAVFAAMAAIYHSNRHCTQKWICSFHVLFTSSVLGFFYEKLDYSLQFMFERLAYLSSYKQINYWIL